MMIMEGSKMSKTQYDLKSLNHKSHPLTHPQANGRGTGVLGWTKSYMYMLTDDNLFK